VKFDEEYMDDDEDDAEEVAERHDVRDQSVNEDEDEDGDNDEDDDEDEEDETALLTNVFEGLANGKKYVTQKDLRNWDIVLELMGDGLLTEDALKELMAQCEGFNGNGVPMEGFDQLVDKLVSKISCDCEYDPLLLLLTTRHYILYVSGLPINCRLTCTVKWMSLRVAQR
jgi:hypothetical protein